MRWTRAPTYRYATLTQYLRLLAVGQPVGTRLQIPAPPILGSMLLAVPAHALLDDRLTVPGDFPVSGCGAVTEVLMPGPITKPLAEQWVFQSLFRSQTKGVVVVIFINPALSRIGRESSVQSACRYR